MFDRIENDLKNHYNRDFRIWQTRIDRIVCKNRLTHLFLNDFQIKFLELVEISMLLWQKSFVNSSHYKNCFSEKFHYVVLRRRFLHERFSRIELLQNMYFQKLSKIRFVDDENLKNFHNYEINSNEIFCVCKAILRCCIYTFVEKTTKFSVFTFAHFEKKRVITYRFKRFVRNLFLQTNLAKQKIKQYIQQFASTSFDVCILFHAKLCCMSQSYKNL